MRKRIVSVIVIFFIGFWLTGCPKKKSGTSLGRISELESLIKNIDQMLPEIDAEIAKQQGNIKKMKDRLKKARENGTRPDVSGLKEYATASGGRTEAYHESPAWKQEQIDKLEGMHVYNVWDASRLAAATTEGNVEEVFIDNEINRSKRFITMLGVYRKRQKEARTKADDELQRIKKEVAQSSTTIDDEEGNGNGGGY